MELVYFPQINYSTVKPQCTAAEGTMENKQEMQSCQKSIKCVRNMKTS